MLAWGTCIVGLGRWQLVSLAGAQQVRAAWLRSAYQVAMPRPTPNPAGLTVTLSVVSLLLVGCDGGSPSLEVRIAQAAKLPGVRSSTHSRLREEYRLVEQSRGLPEHLNTDASLVHKNAAVALRHALADFEEVQKINQQAAALLRTLPAADEVFLQSESGALSAKWLALIASVAEASDLADCDFGVSWELGYFNDLEFLYQAGAGCRLLLVESLYQIEDSPRVAIERFAQAWRWTDWLASSQHLEARVQAAQLRGEALLVLEVLANRPTASTAQLAEFRQILQRSLSDWPTTKSTLVRERALGLATYEAIRLGLIDMLFTLDERTKLRSDGVYESLRAADEERIDADEAAYLAYMREIIRVADQPFYARKKHLVECDRLLRASEQAENYAWFANYLFVLDNSLTLAQAEMARDRGRVAGWVHLLAKATGANPPGDEVNPLNGKKYVVQQQAGGWYVALADRRSVNPRLGSTRR